MTTLTSRPCQLGPTINDRTEKHGNEDKPALDIGVDAYCLTPAEFCELAGHPAAYHGLVDTGSQPPKFAYPNLEPTFAMRETIKGCAAVLLLGLERYELTLADCKLKGGVFTITNSGDVAFGFKLQHEGELTGEQLLKLRAAKNKSIDLALQIGESAAANDAQAGLNLEGGGPSDAKPKRKSRAEKNPEAIAAGAVWSTLRGRFENEDGTPFEGEHGNAAANGAHEPPQAAA